MHVVFLTPLAAFVGLGLLVPIVAVILRERRDQRLRRALDLRAPARRLVPALAGAAVVACLAAAAAQPAIKTSEGLRVRKDAQIYFVFDISRSMGASLHPGAPTRLERAQSFSLGLHRRLEDISTGVATLTDRLLGVLPPTANQRLINQVLSRVIGIDQPPPSSIERISTFFSALVDLGPQGYFSARVPHRLAVVFSDMETDEFDPSVLHNNLAASHVGLILVRFARPGEAIFRPKRGRDPAYEPYLLYLPRVESLAGAGAGGRLFDEHDLGAVVHAARAYLGHGPTMATARARRTIRLGPYAVLAGVLPLFFLLRRR
jgi:hypothetical protein